MATATHLPAGLRAKLSEAVHRVRKLRLARGAGVFVVVMLTTMAACLLADYFFRLPATARGAMLGGWLLLGLVMAQVAILAPLFKRIDLDTLAAAIEDKYPELNERFMSSLGLAENAQSFHGSPELIQT